MRKVTKILAYLFSAISICIVSCEDKNKIDIQDDICEGNSVGELINQLGYATKLDENLWVISYNDLNCDLRFLQLCDNYPDSLKIDNKPLLFSGEIKGIPNDGIKIPFIKLTTIKKCVFDCDNDNYLIPISIACYNKLTKEVAHIINTQEEYEIFKSSIQCAATTAIDFTKYSLAFAYIRYAGCCGLPEQRVDTLTSTITIEVIEKTGCKVLVESQMAFLVPKTSTNFNYNIKIEKTIK
jgi:hypothetical protein